MAGLQLSYTDRSGTVHPQAYMVFSNLRLQTDPPAGELLISIYHDQASYVAGKSPVDPPLLSPFSAPEIAMIATEFGAVPYTILQQRPEYANSQIVP